jgi:hypothetical protein
LIKNQTQKLKFEGQLDKIEEFMSGKKVQQKKEISLQKNN